MKLFPNFTRHHLITHTNIFVIFFLLSEQACVICGTKSQERKVIRCGNKRQDSINLSDEL